MNVSTANAGQTAEARPAARWLSLMVVCLGTFMALSDIYIVYVALPTIQLDLGLSERKIIWVVNGYTIAYGGLLLLCGRLGDCYGHHRVFLLGTVAFTIASLGCALARDLSWMVGVRAVQGAAAAAMSVASLSSVAQQFEKITERAWAVAIYSCIQAAGSSAGLLLGGVLTRMLSWRWMFLVNLPVGIIIYLVARHLRLGAQQRVEGVRVDFAGVASLTAALLLILSWALNAGDSMRLPANTAIALGGSMGLLALFAAIETRVQSPLVPLTLFRNRNLRVAAAFGALRAGALAIWAIIYAFYLQRVRGYDALELGAAFLPYTVTMAMFSLGLADRLILHFGAKVLMSSGAALMVVALLVMSRVPVSASYLLDVLPAMILLGLGNGMTVTPVLLSGLSTVGPKEYGIASAVLSSSILLAATVALAFVAGNTPTQPLDAARAHSYSVALVMASFLAAGAALVGLCVDDGRPSPGGPS